MSLRLLVGGAVAAGVALRVWVLRSRLGALDGDEAVWGLMAQHIRHGELRTFFWGQGYGGTQEAFLTAPLFAIFGPSVGALRAVPIALNAVAAVLVWRVGRRMIGEPAARIAAVLFWLWPAYAVWKSTRAHGFYGSTLVLGLTAVLLALRLGERPSRRDAALFGLAAGCGWWASPQVLILVLPSLLWLALRHRSVFRLWWIALPAALIGAGPWLASNIRYGWPSFHVVSNAGTPASRLHELVATTLPTALGARIPFSLAWLGGVVIGVLLYAVSVAALGWSFRGRSVEPLVAAALVFPVFYAVSPYASLNREPRYLLVLLPVIAILLARWARSGATAVVLVVAATALTVSALLVMRRDNLTAIAVDDRPMPVSIAPVLALLRTDHVERVWANYWIAWRITFESNEQIIAASTGTGSVRYARSGDVVEPIGLESGRYPRYFRDVERAAARAAFVYFARTRGERAAQAILERAGYRESTAGGFVVFSPSTSTT